jgi:hypothetical protein
MANPACTAKPGGSAKVVRRKDGESKVRSQKSKVKMQK